MIAEVEPRAFDGRIDDRETFDALVAQGCVKLRLCRDVAPTERAVQPAKQADQYRTVPAKILERDRSVACDGVQHDVRCAIARLKRSIDMKFWHG
ncbi:hypothetical protein J2S85_005589 [Bradyrhizobium japonicum]|nr:hypothetical protein [Bradyrhizobium japonicum]